MFKFFITTWNKSRYFFMYGGSDLEIMNRLKEDVEGKSKIIWNI